MVVLLTLGGGCGGGLCCVSLTRAIFVVCLERSVGGGLFHKFVECVDEGMRCERLASASLLFVLY